ncbi:farnesyltransferase subunit beta [Rhizoctonia solani AG-1 IA]|uniref:endo-polygalacturonase n=1 Tax=Thanatephorus cucumeris (strain AG1-IA) TaxID=983506 RepID=L8WY18_THACA|nr:farnesyltransferase subunit beta [Rhizoctonia solani AG-1 IA]
MHYLSFAALAFAPILAIATPVSRCTGTIASLDDVAAAQKCTTVTIKGFTVPAGKTFELSLLDNTVVNMEGDVKFGVANWAGPLFSVSGKGITFNGNGHTFDGQGPSYWDGQGGNGGVTKPHPMMKIKISGTYSNVKVLNSPAHTYSISNPAKLVMSKLTIDNCKCPHNPRVAPIYVLTSSLAAGDAPNNQSGGKAAGHNTDGFDVSTTDLTIEDSTIRNQDDCIAINKGSNIIFQRNSCTGGHGISIGSISTGATVQNVQILNNQIINNDQALRIKTKADATSASVSGITFSGNTATGTKKFGVIVDQGYPTTLGAPGNGVKISVRLLLETCFNSSTGNTNNIAVTSSAQRVAVNCGTGCTGTWDWSKLTVTGGKASDSKYRYSGVKGAPWRCRSPTRSNSVMGNKVLGLPPHITPFHSLIDVFLSSVLITNRMQAYLSTFAATPTDGRDTLTSLAQLSVELTSGTSVKLDRPAHARWAYTSLIQGLPGRYTSQDASQPWLIYWALQTLTCLGVQLDPATKQRTIDTIIANQHPDGGFGGGPDIRDLRHGFSRQKCYEFFMRMKQPDGSFVVNKDAEVDVRGTYCLLVVATLLDILTPELVEGTSEFLRSCQTYEGGFASSSHPYYSPEDGKPQVLSEIRPTLGEAHGGYTSCAIASWILLQPYQKPEDPKVNVKKLVRWATGMQGLPIEGGGFRGRTNKLVDGCYSWWIGGLEPLLLELLGLGNDEGETEVVSHVTEETDNAPMALFDKTSLQRFTLVSSQLSSGGLRDKPGKAADLYHTAYNLAGYSTAQHRVYRSLVTERKLLDAWKSSSGVIQGSEEKIRKITWARICAWQEDEGAHFYLGGEGNRVQIGLQNATHPLFNLTISHTRAMMNYFYQQEGL